MEIEPNLQNMTKLFFDTEFTGLHKNTTLISIGIIAESGQTFYAELTDYDKGQVTKWIKDNVVAKLRFTDKITPSCDGWERWNSENRKFINALDFEPPEEDMSHFECIGDKHMVENRLSKWLSQFDKVEMWGDCLAYDWVLFCELFGGALNVPKNIYYIPFDLGTAFKEKGIDPDISREEYAFGVSSQEADKHNALHDARVIQQCYNRLHLPASS